LDIKTFSIYSQAAELVNGIILHAIVGRRAALLTIMAPINNLFMSGEDHIQSQFMMLIIYQLRILL